MCSKSHSAPAANSNATTSVNSQYTTERTSAERPAMVEGSVGIIVAPRGRLFRVLEFTFANGRIASMEVVGDPERSRSIEVSTLDA